MFTLDREERKVSKTAVPEKEVYGKFTEEDAVVKDGKKLSNGRASDAADTDSDDTQLETERGGGDVESCAQSSKVGVKSRSTLRHYCATTTANLISKRESRSIDSADSTVSFDTWAFAISDSRTQAKKQLVQ